MTNTTDTSSTAPTGKSRPAATPLGTQPDDRLVPCKEVLRILSCSRDHLYKELKVERLSAPVKRGRRSLWLLSELNAYLKTIGQTRQA